MRLRDVAERAVKALGDTEPTEESMRDLLLSQFPLNTTGRTFTSAASLFYSKSLKYVSDVQIKNLLNEVLNIKSAVDDFDLDKYKEMRAELDERERERRAASRKKSDYAHIEGAIRRAFPEDMELEVGDKVVTTEELRETFRSLHAAVEVPAVEYPEGWEEMKRHLYSLPTGSLGWGSKDYYAISGTSTGRYRKEESNTPKRREDQYAADMGGDLPDEAETDMSIDEAMEKRIGNSLPDE